MSPALQIALKMAYFHIWESWDTSVYAPFIAVACPSELGILYSTPRNVATYREWCVIMSMRYFSFGVHRHVGLLELVVYKVCCQFKCSWT